MTVFLGEKGRILLGRKGGESAYITLINAADVRENVNRFSVDFAHEQFISGDQIEITTTGGEDLTWIDDPNADSSFTRFAHIDEAGGIRLYDTFNEAIAGERAGAIPLIKPPADQEVSIKIVSSEQNRCLAEVTGYTVTTSRETIDTTNLGAHYRKQYESGLIQGQGQIECFWALPGKDCDDSYGNSDVEFSSYLAKLCIRLVHGAAFHGWFYIYTDESNDSRSVWYESETCIVTNVAVSVTPTELVTASIDFVTSGPIVLKEGYLPSYLLQEQIDAFILTEAGGRIELGNPD